MALLPAAHAQLLHGHVPKAIAASKALGPVPRSTQMSLAIGLPLRNQAELDALLKQVVDSESPHYRQYLTAAQFAERFGPTEEDYQALAGFMRAHGLEVTGTHPNRMILDVSGTLPAIERTFHVNMMRWQHATRGTFFAPDREPSLDAGVTILDVSGLDNFTVPRPMDVKSVPLSQSTPLTTGSGPAGLFLGNDFRTAYAPGVALNGTGQTVGLFELDGFYASDVQANFTRAGLPPVPVQTVLLNGSNGVPGSANIEVILDIMMAAYMAPGLSNIIVYEGYNWNDVLNRMATDNLAKQLSSSWCFSPTNATTEQIFKQFIAQGQSLFQASGDSGAYRGWIMPPADDPYVTVVGGTSLTTSGAGGAWRSETTWPGSGGGVSQTWPIPSYQQTVNMAAAGGSTTMRNIPDVALTADIQMYLIFNNGQQTSVGGTSAAAPLWAGFMALANQQAAANGRPVIGFLNPVIYKIGNGSSFQTDLHDIATGSNGYTASSGYDLATGWGSPAGQSLINDLTGVANPTAFSLSLSAFTLSVAVGASGADTVNINPQNGFSGAVDLAVSGLPAGVTASFSSPSAVTASTLTLTASSSAVPGITALTITGTSGSLTSTARLVLTATAPPSFTLTAAPANVSVLQAGAGNSTLTVTPKGGFSGSVALAAAGLPTGVTASFSPASTTGTSTMTLTASSSAALGAATITVTGTSGSLRSTATLNLTVAAAANYTIAASPASLSVLQGAGGVSTITVVPQTGFSGTVALSVAGLPTGVTAAFSPATAARTSALTFTAAANAAPGTSTVTVTGTLGALTSKATIAVTVAAAPGFTVSPTPASLNIAPGTNVASTIAINALNGFTGTVALTIAGLPTGVTASFNPASTATKSSVVTFTAASNAAARTATVTITGKSGTLTQTAAVTLIIGPLPTFAFSLAPAALSIPLGTTGSSTLTVTPQNGFTGTVALSLTGLPIGVAGWITNNSTPASWVLTLAATASAVPGRATTVSITGKSGALTQTAAISLIVLPPGAGTALVNMTSMYNVTGLATDGSAFTGGGLDAGGRSYSGNLLLPVQNIGGTAFSLGPPNGPDAVSGATIPLPAGRFSTLKLLATGVNGFQAAQVFTVAYTDGTTASFTQSLSDWCTPQRYPGESSAIPMTYRNNSDGTRDSRPLALYGYSFNLSGAKTVSAITLPKNRNVVVLGISLGSNAAASSTVQVSLASAFDTNGIAPDLGRFSGGLDGVGFSYSANLLGTTQTFNNTLFNLGPANAPNSASGNGKTIALPAGKFSAIQLLATGVNGSQLAKSFMVTYTDGTSTTFTQSLSDWLTPQNFPGELSAVRMAYRNAGYGAKDNRTFLLYGYAFALNSGKTVSGIVMPAGVNVKVLAMTLIP